MDSTPPPLPVQSAPIDAATRRILCWSALLTVIGDFLLWPAVPRLSVGLFAVASCAAILLLRPSFAKTKSGKVACLLLGATATQSAIEISFSNVLVLLLISAMILGEASFPEITAKWLRWSEGVGALLRTPLAWRWAGPALKQLPKKPANCRRYREIAVQVGLPTACVVIIFSVILGNGNVIFAQWIGDVLAGATELIPSFNPNRILLWLFIATFALGILRPAEPLLAEQSVTRPIPSFPEPRDLKIAQWRTVSVLAALNAVFFAVNTIDGIYLWIHQAVPEGVNYSDFVHQGVHSLTFAVLLSAVVLTVVYQQAKSVVQSDLVRLLALAWIAQNLVLLGGVLMRLSLYVQAYQLSEQRVYVAAFLCLVAAGFALLARKIVAAKSLRWLILANGVAAFTLFFIIQFMDVAKWVADYNVARWQEDQARVLDVAYLTHLGPSAYPALITVAETPGRSEAHDAFAYLQGQKQSERARLVNRNWRSAQFRKDGYASGLVEHEIRTQR